MGRSQTVGGGRVIGRWSARIGVVLAIVALDGSNLALAQEDISASLADPSFADPGPELSRDAWRQRIEEARRRAKDAARDRREHPELYVPIPEDPDLIASERVLNDESLRSGDIVATNKGMFVFRGHADQPRRPEDFVPLPARPN